MVFALVGASACADAPAVDESDADDVEIAAQAAAPKVTIKSIQPRGDGCKPGTYSAKVSPDGSAFEVVFDDYSVKVAPDQTDVTSAKSCALVLTLGTPSGASYAVTGVQFNGWGKLDQGVTGTQSVRYSWNGAGAVSNTLSVPLRGPIPEGSYSYPLNVPTNDRIYTACGTERELRLETTMSLTNSNPKRSGYLQATNTVGTVQTNLVVRYNLLPCVAGI